MDGGSLDGVAVLEVVVWPFESFAAPLPSLPVPLNPLQFLVQSFDRSFPVPSTQCAAPACDSDDDLLSQPESQPAGPHAAPERPAFAGPIARVIRSGRPELRRP